MLSHKTVSLVPHPDSLPRGIHGVDVRWLETRQGLFVLRWVIKGVDAIAVPAFAGKGRGEALWQTTCGELFLKDRDGAGYREFNFSPSERWAAYRFTGYRDGMADEDIPPPEVSSEGGQHLFVLTALLDASVLQGSELAGLSAVIEEKDGTRSYWAIAHAPGKPDFHNPACFALPLPAPEVA
ncbi:MAG: DOMON-like domain-containing protein [Novosphingobium sp.]|nr:MAG: DOMON-like domain-containing protein [Novosphingobium sp.]